MSKIVSLNELRRRRECFVIAPAGTVHETLYADPEDPEPVEFALAPLADEIWSLGDAAIMREYRCGVAKWATEPGEFIDLKIDPEPHHAGALKWAHELLERTQTNFGINIFGGQGGRPRS
jgi:hypothetical protein